MIQAVALNCSAKNSLVESNGCFQHSKPAASRNCFTVSCSGSRNVPKLEPFSRSKFDRVLKDPPLIQKTENEIADYCLILEGDECYSCWQAYFELKEIERQAPKEEVERLIISAGGVKSLISYVHGVADIYKVKKEFSNPQKIVSFAEEEKSQCPIPDGLPKTSEELEEEEKGRMPDSPFTRLLRVVGRRPASSDFIYE